MKQQMLKVHCVNDYDVHLVPFALQGNHHKKDIFGV